MNSAREHFQFSTFLYNLKRVARDFRKFLKFFILLRKDEKVWKNTGTYGGVPLMEHFCSEKTRRCGKLYKLCRFKVVRKSWSL